MTDMYVNNDDVPVEHETGTDNEIVTSIVMMKEQFGDFMKKGAAS